MFQHKTICRGYRDCLYGYRDHQKHPLSHNSSLSCVCLQSCEKCLGIDTVKQQMLDQAVLSTLPFRDYFTLPDDEGWPCSCPSFKTIQSHSELHAFTLWWRILHYTYISVSAIKRWKFKPRIDARRKRLDEYLPLQLCAPFLHACTDTTLAHKHTLVDTHTHSWESSWSVHDRAPWLDSSLPQEWTPLTHS